MSIEKEYIKKLDEDLMWEMTNLRPKDTNLPVAIYISGRQGQHGPRIKFMNGYGSVKYSALAEMTVEENPKVISNEKIMLSSKEINEIKDWVIKNKSILLDLYNDKITEVQAVKLLFPD